MRSLPTALAFSVCALGLAFAPACAAPAIEDDLGGEGDVTLPERNKTTLPEGGTPSGGGNDSGTPTGATDVTVTVNLTGSGTGTVSSTPAGIACTGTTCTGSFAKGTQVTLLAAPAAGAVFTAWGGGCTGSASCVATASADVTATAELVSLEGTWTGTYTNTRQAIGCTFNNNGNLSTTIKATGAAIAGNETITGLELRQQSGCTLVGTTTGAAPSEAVTVAGNTLTGTYTFNVQNAAGTLAFPYTATVAAKTITGKWTCATCTGGFTLSKP